MSETQVDIARALRVLRSARGWSQAALASKCGLHGSAISDYERGKSLPEYATLARLLAALGYPIHALERVELLCRSLDGNPVALDPAEIPAAAMRLAQEAGNAVTHCCLAFMVLQTGGWQMPPPRMDTSAHPKP